jgi:hypothetical protein
LAPPPPPPPVTSDCEMRNFEVGARNNFA